MAAALVRRCYCCESSAACEHEKARRGCEWWRGCWQVARGDVAAAWVWEQGGVASYGGAARAHGPAARVRRIRHSGLG